MTAFGQERAGAAGGWSVESGRLLLVSLQVFGEEREHAFGRVLCHLTVVTVYDPIAQPVCLAEVVQGAAVPAVRSGRIDVPLHGCALLRQFFEAGNALSGWRFGV